MARAFSAKDAKQLIRQHQKLRNQLIDNYNYAERQKKESNSIASSLFSGNVFVKRLRMNCCQAISIHLIHRMFSGYFAV